MPIFLNIHRSLPTCVGTLLKSLSTLPRARDVNFSSSECEIWKSSISRAPCGRGAGGKVGDRPSSRLHCTDKHMNGCGGKDATQSCPARAVFIEQE